MENIRNIVNYSELSPEWQSVARSNHDDYENELYIEPLKSDLPETHILYDLSDCMRVENNSAYDGVIPLSNNCAIGVKLLSYDTCKLTILS